jgi:hypothetical protein
LEALQLKGLLHHAPPPPVSVRSHPPPIVVMRPSSRPPQPPLARTSPTMRLRVEVDNARRPRSPDRAASPARSPASPARRGPQSPQRRVSPAQSPKQHQPMRKPSNAELPSVRARIARRAAHNAAALSPDDDASTTFSDGGSNSTVSASSRWDFEVLNISLSSHCNLIVSAQRSVFSPLCLFLQCSSDRAWRTRRRTAACWSAAASC